MSNQIEKEFEKTQAGKALKSLCSEATYKAIMIEIYYQIATAKKEAIHSILTSVMEEIDEWSSPLEGFSQKKADDIAIIRKYLTNLKIL